MRDFLFGERNQLRRDTTFLMEEEATPHSLTLNEIEPAQRWSSWLALVGATKPASGGSEQPQGSPMEGVVYFVHEAEAHGRLERYYSEPCYGFKTAKHFESVHWSATWCLTLASLKVCCQRSSNTRNHFADRMRLPTCSRTSAAYQTRRFYFPNPYGSNQSSVLISGQKNKCGGQTQSETSHEWSPLPSASMLRAMTSMALASISV